MQFPGNRKAAVFEGGSVSFYAKLAADGVTEMYLVSANLGCVTVNNGFGTVNTETLKVRRKKVQA